MNATHDEILAIGREVLEIESQGLDAMAERLDSRFTAAVELLAACKGRVVLCGLGKSGLVARKIAATLSSTGTPAMFLHPVEGAHGDMGMLRSGDLLLAISNSGETDELNAIVPAMRSMGVGLIAMTGGLDSTLARMADIVLDCGVAREACHLDLAPTASTTAALAMGDALAICLMRAKDFSEKDFFRFHPAGALGERLKQQAEVLMHTENIPVARPETPLHEALAILDKGGLGALLVTTYDGILQGILTDGDLRRLLAKGPVERNAPVFSVMTANPCHAQPGQSAAELLDLMESKTITVLPVVDDDLHVTGIVHLHDLLGKGRLRFGG